LTVWLRRQEADVLEKRIVAQGLADLAAAGNISSNLNEIFKLLLSSKFPWMKTEERKKEAAMAEMVRRQADQGIITFSPMDMDFLKKKAETMRLPDEWAQKLRDRNKKVRS
jgi:hypothetical protein